MTSGNNTTIIKKANTYLLLAAIRSAKTVTVKQLEQITGLSRPTICNILSSLKEKQIIREDGYIKSEAGRQPVVYRMNTSKNFVIGIDLELPTVRLLFCTIEEEIIYSYSWEQSSADSPEQFLIKITDSVKNGLTQLQITEDHVFGICLGISGLADTEHNMILQMPRMKSLDGSDLPQKLQERLGIQVCIRNDVHLMSFADRIVRSTPIDNCLYIGYRTGIGMAIFQHGRLLEGSSGNTGYIGHTTVCIDGPVCSCGNIGCLDLYASKHALMKKYLQANPAPHPINSFQELLKLADSGDSTAQNVLSDGSKYIGTAIANAMKLFDSKFVILGDLEKNQFYFHEITKVITAALANSVNLKDPQILLSDADPSSCAKGACALAVDQFFKEPRLRLAD